VASTCYPSRPDFAFQIGICMNFLNYFAFVIVLGRRYRGWSCRSCCFIGLRTCCFGALVASFAESMSQIFDSIRHIYLNAIVYFINWHSIKWYSSITDSVFIMACCSWWVFSLGFADASEWCGCWHNHLSSGSPLHRPFGALGEAIVLLVQVFAFQLCYSQ